ncbi:MAG: aspartate kinase [Planctomycetota bacterium]|nr:aspartate kinase [Planctomycetota bacterium]
MALVMKFGGTSVGDGPRIKSVADIVLSIKDSGEMPVVVSSAHSGITNMLFEAANRALKGDKQAAESVRARQKEIIASLDLDETLVDKELNKLEEMLHGVRMLGELSPRSLDTVVSFGERMSTKVIAAHIRSRGRRAEAFAAYDVGLTTTRRFGQARPLPDAAEDINQKVGEILKNEVIPIITGYIGKSEDGCITTLGRNGSDYSAAIFGAAIEAREIQIWTDVPGILTTDPRVVPSARLIKALSFSEASELANYGAKVIHPSTLTPAVEKSIPIRVKSTMEPSGNGSVIIPQSQRSEEIVKAIAHKDGITLVHIHETRMLGRPGFLSKIAKVFQIHKIDVDMIATSEVSVSLTVEDTSHLDRAVKRLERFAKVTVVHDRAIVCVVGEGLAETPRTIARVFDAMANIDVPIDLISQGATRLNLGLVVPAKDVKNVVNALHQELFPE